MADMLEIYNNGTKVGSVPAFIISGRPLKEISLSEYNAEQTHTPGTIYIVWEDD